MPEPVYVIYEDIVCSHLKLTDPEWGYCFEREVECGAVSVDAMMQCSDYGTRGFLKGSCLHGD